MAARSPLIDLVEGAHLHTSMNCCARGTLRVRASDHAGAPDQSSHSAKHNRMIRRMLAAVRHLDQGGQVGTLSPSGRPLPELTGIPPDRPDSEDPAEPSRARQAR